MQKTIKATLKFPADITDQPIAYHLVKDYDVEFSILQAQIGEGKVGRLTLELKGEADNLEKAMAFLESKGVSVRIFSKSIIWNEEQCVHCGVCTGLCPSGALYMNTDRLGFDQSKCLICELCISVCPVNAIDADFFD